MSLILASVSLMVFPQNSITSAVSSRENLLSFSFHLARKSSLWFPIEGSNSSFKPLGITFAVRHRSRNSLCVWNRASLSLRRSNFPARYRIFLSSCVSMRNKVSVESFGAGGVTDMCGPWLLSNCVF